MDGDIIIMKKEDFSEFMRRQENRLNELVANIQKSINLKTESDYDRLFIKDILKELNMSRSTFYRRMDEFPVHKDGKGVIFMYRTDLKGYLKSNFPHYYDKKKLNALEKDKDSLVREICK